MLGGEWRGIDLWMDWDGVSDRMAYHAYGYALCRTALFMRHTGVSVRQGHGIAWAGRMTMSVGARRDGNRLSAICGLWSVVCHGLSCRVVSLCVSSHVFEITDLTLRPY